MSSKIEPFIENEEFKNYFLGLAGTLKKVYRIEWSKEEIYYHMIGELSGEPRDLIIVLKTKSFY